MTSLVSLASSVLVMLAVSPSVTMTDVMSSDDRLVHSVNIADLLRKPRVRTDKHQHVHALQASPALSLARTKYSAFDASKNASLPYVKIINHCVPPATHTGYYFSNEDVVMVRSELD